MDKPVVAAPVIPKPAAPPSPPAPKPAAKKPAEVTTQDVDGIAVGDSAALKAALEEEEETAGVSPADRKVSEGAALGERFEKPPAAPGVVICRFCKGPLDLEGDFCEQCGAPVEDAAPPGTVLKRKAQPAAPAAPAGPPLAVPIAGLSQSPAKPAAAPPPPAAAPAPPRPESPKPANSSTGGRLAVTPPEGAKTARPAPGKTGAAPAASKPAAPVATPPKAAEAPRKTAGPVTAPPAKPATPSPRVPAEVVRAIQEAAEEKTRVAMAPLAVPGPTAATPKKAFPVMPLVGGVVLLAALAGGGIWYFTQGSKQQPAPQAAAPPPRPVTAPSQAQTTRATVPEQPAAEPARARTAAAKQPAPKPAPAPPAPAADPKAAQIANFQNLARDAYGKGSYAEPANANAIAYCEKVLALDPANAYAKGLLETSVNGGKYQVQQAIFKKDFPTAHRLSDTMAKMLPNRSDVLGLKEDIASAERTPAPRPAALAPVLSFKAYHMHSEKSPADNGPYCLGTLGVAAGHIKFAGESASAGQQVDNLDFACADVREVKKNARVASKQSGFHVRTSSTNVNFVPQDSSAAHISALASACGK